jgi:hypothetical protein
MQSQVSKSALMLMHPLIEINPVIENCSGEEKR